VPLIFDIRIHSQQKIFFALQESSLYSPALLLRHQSPHGTGRIVIGRGLTGTISLSQLGGYRSGGAEGELKAPKRLPSSPMVMTS